MSLKCGENPEHWMVVFKKEQQKKQNQSDSLAPELIHSLPLSHVYMSRCAVRARSGCKRGVEIDNAVIDQILHQSSPVDVPHPAITNRAEHTYKYFEAPAGAGRTHLSVFWFEERP